MLVLSRKVGEQIIINEEITITVVRSGVGGCSVRLGITAPKGMNIRRGELPARLEKVLLPLEEASSPPFVERVDFTKVLISPSLPAPAKLGLCPEGFALPALAMIQEEK